MTEGPFVELLRIPSRLQLVPDNGRKLIETQEDVLISTG